MSGAGGPAVGPQGIESESESAGSSGLPADPEAAPRLLHPGREEGMKRIRSSRPQRVTRVWLASIWLASAAGAQTLPQQDGEVHGGVKTCAGGPCHGHASPVDKAVMLDEAIVWRRHDLHARAYDVLLNERSVRIAKNLGLREKAHEAKLCLDCHADFVPTEQRGRRFRLDEGVGCEACHGGSGRWLKRHSTGTSHRENLDLGMYPTDDPVKRAELCLSCHYGTREKFVDHRLMGAGHPRQSFELHVFTQTQPAHYQIDADYVERGKRAPDGIEVWATGQAVAARHVLDVLLDPELSKEGIWPEFVLFDCHACHHDMSDDRWRPRPSVGLGPGLARLNDSSFLMLRHAMRLLEPERASAFQRDTRALHQATSRGVGDQQVIARRLRGSVEAMIPVLEQWQVDAAGSRSLARAIVAEGLSGEYVDYVAAEQVAMALQVLVDGMYGLRAYDPKTLARLADELPALLEATKDPEAYDPARLTRSLARLRPLLGTS